MRWLASSTHLLKDSNWSIPSMGKVIDILEETLSKIMNDRKKMLSDAFMNAIWEPLSQEIIYDIHV